MTPTLRPGTSGYAYREWKGSFYPADLPADAMLAFYAKHFDAVEINNTFYRTPQPAVIAAWRAQVPERFTFALKGPQTVTHRKRLKDPEAGLARFFAALADFGPQLGPILFGLPPFLKRDLPRLEDFLALLPPARRIAMDFRHPSWFDERVFEALRRHKVALCLSDHDEAELSTPREITCGWGYVRLRRRHYSDAALRQWLAWLQSQPLEDAFVFCKHEQSGAGVAAAQELTKLSR